MKLNKIIYLIGVIAMMLHLVTEENPLENEQYIKQVYIVGAYDIVQKFVYLMETNHKIHTLLLLRAVV